MSKKLHFKVSARTARLIGRENISNAESALIELVKNSYDADAESCIIYFDKNNKLYILDDGHGMTGEVIENHWMTIGTNNKEIEYVSSKLGRIKSGEKGLGRFALDRLGQTCLLHTKPENSNDGYPFALFDGSPNFFVGCGCRNCPSNLLVLSIFLPVGFGSLP